MECGQLASRYSMRPDPSSALFSRRQAIGLIRRLLLSRMGPYAPRTYSKCLQTQGEVHEYLGLLDWAAFPSCRSQSGW